MNDNKYKKLLLSIVLDTIGNISYLIPGIAEGTDIVWAPISAYLMKRLYSGNKGKIGAVVSFFEEIIPGTDFIPSFTLMWIYTYIINPKETKKNKL